MIFDLSAPQYLVVSALPAGVGGSFYCWPCLRGGCCEERESAAASTAGGGGIAAAEAIVQRPPPAPLGFPLSGNISSSEFEGKGRVLDTHFYLN